MGLFSRLFGKKQPEKPRVRTLGHRGTGGQGGSPDCTASNTWQTLSADEVDAFVYKGKFLAVQSSNVAGASYERDGRQMVVSFLNGSAYRYFDVSEDEAVQFVQAFSKGKAVWDLFRGRSPGAGKRFVREQ